MDWQTQIKQKLLDFLREFKEVCADCGRKDEVKVLFATKYLSPEKLVMFLNVAKDYMNPPILIGENRVQEAEEKLVYLKKHAVTIFARPPLAKMVMIGNLQKNKINKAIKIFSEIHAVDNLELAEALNKRLERENKTMPVFLEVNVSREESKRGFKVEDVERVIRDIRKMRAIKVKGLMTMAPYRGDLEEIRGVFGKLKELADRYNLRTSMGMSSDWQVAVEEGADMIRIGSVIFK